MKMSRRAKRMERHHQKAKTPALNLVSLMDIFTILVFFLLVSSTNTQQLPSNKDLRLPSSTSATVPEETLIIAITREDILVKGVAVARVQQVLTSDNANIPALKEELLFLAGASSAGAETEQRRITIMADEEVPYDVIRKVLTSCQESQYTRVAFSAVKKTRPRGNS